MDAPGNLVIFIDTNLFLRRMTPPASEADAARQVTANHLFDRAERGEVALTASEAVLAEVAFVLTNKRQYGLSVPEAVHLMVPLVRFRGLTLDRPSVVLDALFIWRDHPSIGFVDALGTAYGKQPKTELASFDAGLDRVPGVKRYELSAS